jgi:aryl-alcohol dehydrogenase-like predicted oxidoreductase
MEYSRFGKTGQLVSRIGFGGATAGLKNYVRTYDPESRADQEKVIRAIHRALELGITYFDTAPGYGDGASERIFGEALEGARVSEEAETAGAEIFVATKVTPRSEPAWRDEMEASIERLRRPHVDLFQIHGTVYAPEHDELIFRRGGLLDELERARADGLVRFIGFTVEAINETTLKLIKCGRFDTIQLAYNLIYQHPYDPYWKAGTMFDAEAEGLGIAVMRTVTSGVFQKWIQAVNPGNTFDYSAGLVQFVLSNPLVDVALLGMRSAERVEQNVAICNDTSGRIDIAQVHGKYPTADGRQAK